MTKSPEIIQCEIDYERNFNSLYRARPGSKRYERFAKREKVLNLRYFQLATKEKVYIHNPCKLSRPAKRGVECRHCSGWYKKKYIVKNDKLEPVVVEAIQYDGEKCKVK